MTFELVGHDRQCAAAGQSPQWVESGRFGVITAAMKTAQRFTLAFATLLPMTGCGQNLGDYAVEDIRVVPDIPRSHVGSPSPPYDRYLEIRLASKTNLTSIGRKVDAVYVDADFCPLRNPNGLIAFGPYSDNKQDLGLPGEAKALDAGKDGLVRYRLYVVAAYKATQAFEPGHVQLPAYNLQAGDRDLCLRLFATGYNLIKSRSETIRVPADMVASAIKKASVRAQS
jgi:hypothetical protein